MALKLCKQTNDSDEEALCALAIAYAECGEFAQAIQAMSKAIELARNWEDVVEEFRHKLQLFEQRKPYRLPKQ